MGYLNNIFNSLRVISEGAHYSTTGFTVTYSGTGLPIPAGSNTSFMVRDGGYVGIGTNLPNTGWGTNANLHVVGNARVTNIPTGGKSYLTTDIFGNILQNSGIPIIPVSGDCVITSAYTSGVSGCILFMVTNCTGTTAPGRVLVNGNVAYTADTCSDWLNSPSPYEWGIGMNSIQPILAGNFANANWSSIGGGFTNDITTGSNMSRVGGGMANNILGDSMLSYIGGGLSNIITNGSNSSNIGGGTSNMMVTSPWSTIVGGMGNQIWADSTHSAILGGLSNIITGASQSAIINGTTNRILPGHDGSVIMNGPAMVSDDDYTTYTRGLNVDSINSTGGAKYFRYHGALANPGLNFVLTDSTGFGDAVWSRNTSPGASWTGDCAVMSAYTVDCTLYMVTDCTGATGSQYIINGWGNVVYTANTCNSFNSGPYRYGLNSAIEPILGVNNADGLLSNIGGGQGNTVDLNSQWSNIGNGVNNTIENSRVSSILGGQQNTVDITGWSNGYGAIVNGFQNEVNHQYSVIMGGANMTTDRDFTVFTKGLDVDTDANDPLGVMQQSPLRYHGLFANEGLNRVLTDSDGLGNAVWRRNPTPGASWTGDCAVVSAYTEGCTLYMMTDCTGTTVGSINVNGYITYTADTCNSFTDGPYEYASGGICSTNSIQPKLGANVISAFTSNITGGLSNIILGGCETAYTEIGGGSYWNKIYKQSMASSIHGGAFNKLGVAPAGTPAGGVTFVNIVGGAGNQISGATYSSILGGNVNRVLGTNSTPVTYGVVINGLNNHVKHDGSVIMNGPSFTTDDTYTTYTRGLNVNSLNSTGGPKYFKYHGALANPGFGKVLVDSTGFGDAVWADGGTYTFSGDQYVTSAYTSGCTLYIVTNSGNTFTADTCHTFGGTSPYEYRGGVNSISTVLPGFGVAGDNYIRNSLAYSNIGGGAYNKLNTSGPGYNNIAGGYDNTIGGSNINVSEGASGYDFIGGGYENKIRGYDQFYAAIGGGYKNWVLNSGGGFIGGGMQNIITGGTISFIGAGDLNKIFKPYSSIVGGRDNAIYANYSNIGGGTVNTVGSPIGGTTAYAGIFNGSGNTIGRNAEYAAIIGSRGINYASSPETTYMKGLDANTNGYNGINRPLKYHGGYANEGLGRILTSDALGNASWQDPGFRAGLTGDCVVATAYTVNCILYLVTSCTGTTTPNRLLVGDHIAYTADTCHTFGGTSPYKFGMTTGSIDTTLTLSNNVANGGWFDVISGGRNNRTTIAYHSGIHAGRNNAISGAVESEISAGYSNKIVYSEASFIGAGWHNYVGTINKSPASGSSPGVLSNRFSNIVGGSYNEILQSDESIIGAGQYNYLRLTYQSFLGGGDHNILTGDSASVLVGGYFNTMKSVQKGFLGGGAHHFMEGGLYNGLVGGYTNTINNNSSYSFIGGGMSNTLGDTSGSILWTQFSSILGGRSNKIQSDGGVLYAGIVNGQANTVTADYAAIIGGQSLTADRTHTTFMNGLDVDVASSSGTRLFRYHGVGSFAGSAGDVLTSLNTSGDAIWATPTAPGASWTGDCAVVSAYTVDCTLYMVTNCTGATGSQYVIQGGNIVYTANTCGSQGTGPYRFGTNSGIEPILGGNNGDGFRASIGGGQNNTVDAASAWSNVGAGVTNTITDSRVSSILGGHQNTINIPGLGDGYGAIINGFQNQVTHEYSVVMGGRNILSDKSFTTFMNGLDVDTNAIGVNRYFKYYGTLAAPGLNNVLVDVDGTGNAVWRKNTAPGVSWSGDQYVISAYTTGCTLHIVTNSGNTFTADTCNSMNNSPYQYGAGTNNIRPKLPSTGPTANEMSNTSWFSNIGGGQSNKMTGGTVSVIAGGYNNKIKGASGASIGGGHNHEIGSTSHYSTISGGWTNKIRGGNTWANAIVGGYGNDVSNVLYSGILAGKENLIENAASTNFFSAIVGGNNNTVNHKNSVIVGGGNITTDRTYTTFTNGLDAHTDSDSGQKPFKYHGTYAAEGLGKILVSDASGNASWQNLSTPGVSFSGDQYVVSAYTTGCTLFVTTNSGNTYTANTCNEFSDSPYEYRGVNSISTKLPGSGIVGDNYVLSTVPWSNIGGGSYNKLNTSGPGFSNIAGGYNNTIGGADIDFKVGYSGYDFIGGGSHNKITGTDSFYQSIVGGSGNWLLSSNHGFIGGGAVNIITGSTGGFIGGGAINLIDKGDGNASNSSILGGTYNSILASKDSVIAGGKDNTISLLVGGTTDYAGIFNGSGNTIGRNAEYAAIIGSRGITYANSPETTYMKGLDANTNGYNGIDRPFKYHGTYASHGNPGDVLMSADALGNAHWRPIGIPSTDGDEVVVSAETTGCTITFFTNSGNTFTADTCNGSYSPYRPTGTNSIVPTLPGPSQAGENIISADSWWSNIGGGQNNDILLGSNRSVIAGGVNNQILDTSDWSNISGGVNNTIETSRASTILGGNQNIIDIPGVLYGYGTVVNGYTNTVNHQYSVIMGGGNMTTDREFTVFMRGLDVNTTEPAGGWIPGPPQELPFRYHGGFANEGATKILTSDASGNATWQNSGMIGYSGDQFVVSAYTTGCTLHIVTNSGNTYTATTCNTHDNSPYEYDLGSNSIVPKLPSLPGWKNTIGIGGINSVISGGLDNNISGKGGNTIAGGYYNDIGSTHHWGSIVGGYDNKLTGSDGEQCTAIVGGWNNEIYNQQRSFIGGGKDNLIFQTVGGFSVEGHSSILGGTGNNISGATHSSIIGGINNVLRSEANYSVILGGGDSITGSTPSTAYMTNSQTMGKARIASQNYLSTNSLNTTLAKTALDVVHETSDLTSLATDTGGGEIVRFGLAGGDYAAGYLVQLQAGSWVKADAADVASQGNMLGIALGAAPTNGILIRGFYKMYNAHDLTGTEVEGQPLYVSTTDGEIENVPPSTATQYVRAVGYLVDIITPTEIALIYFNPDSTYITLT